MHKYRTGCEVDELSSSTATIIALLNALRSLATSGCGPQSLPSAIPSTWCTISVPGTTYVPGLICARYAFLVLEDSSSCCCRTAAVYQVRVRTEAQQHSYQIGDKSKNKTGLRVQHGTRLAHIGTNCPCPALGRLNLDPPTQWAPIYDTAVRNSLNGLMRVRGTTAVPGTHFEF